MNVSETWGRFRNIPGTNHPNTPPPTPPGVGWVGGYLADLLSMFSENDPHAKRNVREVKQPSFFVEMATFAMPFDGFFKHLLLCPSPPLPQSILPGER